MPQMDGMPWVLLYVISFIGVILTSVKIYFF